MPEWKVSTRRFTLEDQQAFASFSGDANPMHVDPVAARRLLFGKVVVHGIHALLWGLDKALENKSSKGIRSINASFRKPLALDSDITSEWSWQDNLLKLNVRSEAGLALFSTAKFDEQPKDAGEIEPGVYQAGSCRELDSGNILKTSGQFPLQFDERLCRELLPNLLAALPQDQIAALAAASQVVGCHCPGLHSVFSSLELSDSDGTDDRLVVEYDASAFDERFSFATINFKSPSLTGTVTAFLRPRPVNQADYAESVKQVEPNEFMGVRSLVIGGSRGLGETTAKLLAAGGAEVRSTFHMGREDAARLDEEIRSSGGICSSHELDVLNPEEGLAKILKDSWKPTHLFYYPTPPIFEGREGVFNHRLFQKFSSYYIEGFLSILRPFIQEKTPLKILYPSTVALDELPPDMAEYCCAKSAGETACAGIEKQYPQIKIYCPRFPRLETDQTASLYPVENKQPAPILLAVMREMASQDG